MADKVLVTGISGFLGGHVALALLNAGYEVRGSVRDLGKADKVKATLGRATASGTIDALEIIALDLLRDEGWVEAAQGCRYVQHVASPFVVKMPANKDDLIRPAVEGTRRALRAAIAAGAERVVLTSSAAAIMYGHPPGRAAPFTEADWSTTEGADVTAYTESKTRAELEAWSIMESCGHRAELAVVNPVGILGPLLDDDPGTSGMLVQRLMNGTIPAAPKIYFGAVDVRDVAELQVKAMESADAGGRRFLASSADVLSFMDYARLLRATFPDYARKIPRFEVPNWLVRLFATIDPDMRGNVGSLGVLRRTDSSAGAALLGHPFISSGDAAIAMARTLIAEKLV